MFRKVIASVLTLTFLVQSLGFSQIQPLELSAAKPVQIEIPKEFGEIVSTPFASSKSNFIIHIQDAHGSYEAQQNIEKIIRHLAERYKIKTLFLEGGAGKLAPEQFHFFEDRKLDLKVADLLMKRGAFTGAEKFLLSGKAEGYGIEDISFYRDNFNLFESAVNAQPKADLELKKLKAETQNQLTRIFSKDARDFVKAWEIHQSENSDWMRYLSVLDNAAEKHLKLDLRNPENQIDLPMLVRYFNLKNRNVDAAKAAGERKAFLEFLKGKISAELYQKLSHFEENDNPRSLFESLQEEISKKQIKLPEFPNFIRYAGNRMLQSEMISKELFSEMNQLSGKVFEALLKTSEEKAILKKIRERILLEKLAHLELTREEWSALSFRRRPESSVFSTAADFYRAAEKRESAFLKNIEAAAKKNKLKSAILVTGGFHAEGLDSGLKQLGYSVITIHPNFTDTENSRKNYLGAMLPETSQLARALELNAPQTFESLVTSHWSAVYRHQREVVVQEVADGASLGSIHPSLKESFLTQSRKWMKESVDYAENPFFKTHVQNSSRRILDGAENLSGTALLLGLGNAVDYTLQGLAKLAGQFNKLVAVDIDRDAVQNTLKRLVTEGYLTQQEVDQKFEIRSDDLGGVLVEFSNGVNSIIQNSGSLAAALPKITELIKNLSVQPLDFEKYQASYVVSSLVLSTLTSYIFEHINGLLVKKFHVTFWEMSYPQFTPVFQDFVRKMQVQHIRNLRSWVAPEGRVYFADTTHYLQFVPQTGSYQKGNMVVPPVFEEMDRLFRKMGSEEWVWGEPGPDRRPFLVQSKLFAPLPTPVTPKSTLSVTREMVLDILPKNISPALKNEIFALLKQNKTGFSNARELEKFIREAYDELKSQGASLGAENMIPNGGLNVQKILTDAERRLLTPQFASFQNFYDSSGGLEKWKQDHPDSKLVVFVRHGESVSNVFRMPQSADLFSPLTGQGKQQKKILRNFMRTFSAFDWYGSSDLERAYQTTEGLARDAKKKLHVLEMMREVSIFPIGGINVNLHQDLYEKNKRIFDFDPARYERLGLSMPQVRKDLHKFFFEIIPGQNEQTFLIGTHGGSIHWSLMTQLGISFSKYRSIAAATGTAPNGSLTAAEYNAKTKSWSLLVYGDNSFLPEKLRHHTKGVVGYVRETIRFYLLAVWRLLIKPFSLLPKWPDAYPASRTFIHPSREKVFQMLSPYFKSMKEAELAMLKIEAEKLSPPKDFPKAEGASLGRARAVLLTLILLGPLGCASQVRTPEEQKKLSELPEDADRENGFTGFNSIPPDFRMVSRLSQKTQDESLKLKVVTWLYTGKNYPNTRILKIDWVISSHDGAILDAGIQNEIIRRGEDHHAVRFRVGDNFILKSYVTVSPERNITPSLAERFSAGQFKQILLTDKSALEKLQNDVPWKGEFPDYKLESIRIHGKENFRGPSPEKGFVILEYLSALQTHPEEKMQFWEIVKDGKQIARGFHQFGPQSPADKINQLEADEKFEFEVAPNRTRAFRKVIKKINGTWNLVAAEEISARSLGQDTPSKYFLLSALIGLAACAAPVQRTNDPRQRTASVQPEPAPVVSARPAAPRPAPKEFVLRDRPGREQIHGWMKSGQIEVDIFRNSRMAFSFRTNRPRTIWIQFKNSLRQDLLRGADGGDLKIELPDTKGQFETIEMDLRKHIAPGIIDTEAVIELILGDQNANPVEIQGPMYEASSGKSLGNGKGFIRIPESVHVPVKMIENYAGSEQFEMDQASGFFIQDETGGLWAPVLRDPLTIIPSSIHGRSMHSVPNPADLPLGDDFRTRVVKGVGTTYNYFGEINGLDQYVRFHYIASEPIDIHRFRGGEILSSSRYAAESALKLHAAYQDALNRKDPLILLARERFDVRSMPVLKPFYLLKPLKIPMADREVRNRTFADPGEVLSRLGVPGDVIQDYGVFVYEVPLNLRLFEVNTTQRFDLSPYSQAWLGNVFNVAPENREEILRRFTAKLVTANHVMHEYLSGSFSKGDGHGVFSSMSPMNVTLSGDVVDLDTVLIGIPDAYASKILRTYDWDYLEERIVELARYLKIPTAAGTDTRLKLFQARNTDFSNARGKSLGQSKVSLDELAESYRRELRDSLRRVVLWEGWGIWKWYVWLFHWDKVEEARRKFSGKNLMMPRRWIGSAVIELNWMENSLKDEASVVFTDISTMHHRLLRALKRSASEEEYGFSAAYRRIADQIYWDMVLSKNDSRIEREGEGEALIPISEIRDYIFLVRRVIPGLKPTDDKSVSAASLGRTAPTIRELEIRFDEICDFLVNSKKYRTGPPVSRDKIWRGLEEVDNALSNARLFEASQKLRKVIAKKDLIEIMPETFLLKAQKFSKELEKLTIPKNLVNWMQRGSKKKERYSPERARAFDEILQTNYKSLNFQQLVDQMWRSIAPAMFGGQHDEIAPLDEEAYEFDVHDVFSSELGWIPGANRYIAQAILWAIRTENLSKLIAAALYLEDAKSEIREAAFSGGYGPMVWSSILHHYAMLAIHEKSFQRPSPPSAQAFSLGDPKINIPGIVWVPVKIIENYAQDANYLVYRDTVDGFLREDDQGTYWAPVIRDPSVSSKETQHGRSVHSENDLEDDAAYVMTRVVKGCGLENPVNGNPYGYDAEQVLKSQKFRGGETVSQADYAAKKALEIINTYRNASLAKDLVVTLAEEKYGVKEAPVLRPLYLLQPLKIPVLRDGSVQLVDAQEALQSVGVPQNIISEQTILVYEAPLNTRLSEFSGSDKEMKELRAAYGNTTNRTEIVKVFSARLAVANYLLQHYLNGTFLESMDPPHEDYYPISSSLDAQNITISGTVVDLDTVKTGLGSGARELQAMDETLAVQAAENFAIQMEVPKQIARETYMEVRNAHVVPKTNLSELCSDIELAGGKERFNDLKKIEKIVNNGRNGNRKTSMLYPGSGADISTALQTTDADTFIFVDRARFEWSPEDFYKKLYPYMSVNEKYRNPNIIDHYIRTLVLKYFGSKKGSGYGYGYIIREIPVWELLKLELQILGVPEPNYTRDPEQENVFHVRFHWKGKERHLIFIGNTDAHDISKYSRFMGAGVDFLMMKAGEYSHYVDRNSMGGQQEGLVRSQHLIDEIINKWMNGGGFLVSDSTRAVPHHSRSFAREIDPGGLITFGYSTDNDEAPWVNLYRKDLPQSMGASSLGKYVVGHPDEQLAQEALSALIEMRFIIPEGMVARIHKNFDALNEMVKKRFPEDSKSLQVIYLDTVRHLENVKQAETIRFDHLASIWESLEDYLTQYQTFTGDLYEGDALDVLEFAVQADMERIEKIFPQFLELKIPDSEDGIAVMGLVDPDGRLYPATPEKWTFGNLVSKSKTQKFSSPDEFFTYMNKGWKIIFFPTATDVEDLSPSMLMSVHFEASSLGGNNYLKGRYRLETQLEVARVYTGKIVWMPGASNEALKSALKTLGLFNRSTVKVLDARAAGFNQDLGPISKYLGLSASEFVKGVPIILEDSVCRDQSTAQKVAGKLLGAMRDRDLLAVNWENQKPAFISQLRQAANGRFEVKDVQRKVFTEAVLKQWTRRFDVAPIWIGAVGEENAVQILFANSDRVQLNLDILGRNGIDPTQVVALLRQIAAHPDKRQELFSRAGFTKSAAGWEAGENFVSLLLSKIYADHAVRRSVQAAA